MRRFGWQIGGLGVALGALVGLGSLAFGCGGRSSVPVGRHVPVASARATATPTADPRVAQVEEAARAYITALATSMRSGSADELARLSVPGSQAEGNAGVAAGIVHDKRVAFVTTNLDVRFDTTDVNSSTAEVALDYSLVGYDAQWPSLRRTAPPRTIQAHAIFDFTLAGQQWLVESVR
jgi:hypothetical protein